MIDCSRGEMKRVSGLDRKASKHLALLDFLLVNCTESFGIFVAGIFVFLQGQPIGESWHSLTDSQPVHPWMLDRPVLGADGRLANHHDSPFGHQCGLLISKPISNT
ncbi:hypothetical protein AAEH92_16165 [Shewanella xiamenensis]|uniref:hypothetical protein n=1 Tax=Shewanella xiamenensis TaxID=332186 RepID=UPI00313D32B6